jgi:alkyl hydroperoxide reductase subunit AhpC
MPNVKKLYAAYHSKGLEIYGVSLDENMVNWQNAVNQMKMPWIQVSDLKGWQSEGASTYSIRAIPATVLIDQNGNIIAKNLRGNELAKKVSEILKK